MESPGAAIAARLREWGTSSLPVEREVFGTERPDEIAGAVDAWCRVHLGASVERYEFFESSSGSVHGVLLTDGRAVVVKGHRAAVTRDYLAEVTDLQTALADSGYPAPRPLAGPVAAGGGHVTAEVMLDRSPDERAPRCAVPDAALPALRLRRDRGRRGMDRRTRRGSEGALAVVGRRPGRGRPRRLENREPLRSWGSTRRCVRL